MKFIPAILCLISILSTEGTSATIFHLDSGEEIEGEPVSIREKHIVTLNRDSILRPIPYIRIAAIRLDGRLHTDGFDARSLSILFPNLVPEPVSGGFGPAPGNASPGWEFKAAQNVPPEGHYLTFQGLSSLAAFRPLLTFNYERTTGSPVHFSCALIFELGGLPADTAFRGEKIGVGAKTGIRKYPKGKLGWYFQGDLGAFHFFNGMLGGDRSYFGAGPFLGYKARFEKVVLDANMGWMHVFNEPRVIPDLPIPDTGEESIDWQLRFHKATTETVVKNLYPLMRFEANFALGFKL